MRLCDSASVLTIFPVFEVTGNEHDRLRVVAVRQRNTAIGSATGRSGDAGHDLERNSLGRERFDNA
jgi:hypothetical protein